MLKLDLSQSALPEKTLLNLSSYFGLLSESNIKWLSKLDLNLKNNNLESSSL
jgi:hypothetical protein